MKKRLFLIFLFLFLVSCANVHVKQFRSMPMPEMKILGYGKIKMTDTMMISKDKVAGIPKISKETLNIHLEPGSVFGVIYVGHNRSGKFLLRRISPDGIKDVPFLLGLGDKRFDVVVLSKRSLPGSYIFQYFRLEGGKYKPTLQPIRFSVVKGEKPIEEAGHLSGKSMLAGER